MNELIKECVLQARKFATTQHPITGIVLYTDPELFEQKFAELIVRECSKFVDENSGWGLEKCLAFDMLKHFGVEE